MVVNPPTGVKSPRSFSYRPGANPLKPSENPQTRPFAPLKPGPVITLPTFRTVIPAPAHITKFAPEPISVIELCGMITEIRLGAGVLIGEPGARYL